MTASITLLSSSVVALQVFTGNVNTRFDAVQSYTTSVNSRFANLGTYTSSVETRLTEIGVVSGSLISSASAVSNSVWHLHQFSSSQLEKDSNLGTYTGSVETRFTEIGIVSSSLIISASAVSNSVWNLNTFSASITNSIVELYATASDHESRIDYIEGIAFGDIDLEEQFLAIQQVTSSLHTFTSSALTRLSTLEVETSNLETFSGSTITKLNNLELTSASINAWSSSLTNTFATDAEVAAGYEAQGRGIVSGSSQILGGSTIHSSSVGNYEFNSIGVGTAASTTAGEIRAIADITAYYSSDIRLKENVIPIENALEKVNQISGNTYDWKEGYDEVHSHKGNDVGVIAQEIEQILPQIVTNRDNGFKAVQYEKIIPLLIEAVKELSAKVDRLENK
jgi:hypothetical protein